MEYVLSKPYTEKEKCDFIVKYNHNMGLEIIESKSGLIAKEHTITEEELKEQRINEIQHRLDELSQDFIQILCGAEIENADERKEEFKTLHNELRALLGKEPREYN